MCRSHTHSRSNQGGKGSNREGVMARDRSGGTAVLPSTADPGLSGSLPSGHRQRNQGGGKKGRQSAPTSSPLLSKRPAPLTQTQKKDAATAEPDMTDLQRELHQMMVIARNIEPSLGGRRKRKAKRHWKKELVANLHFKLFGKRPSAHELKGQEGNLIDKIAKELPNALGVHYRDTPLPSFIKRR